MIVVSGTVTHTVEARGATVAEAVERWKKLAGEGYPDDWEDDQDPDRCGSIVAGCESCGRPILEGDAYQSDDDGIYWHDDCPVDNGAATKHTELPGSAKWA